MAIPITCFVATEQPRPKRFHDIFDEVRKGSPYKTICTPALIKFYKPKEFKNSC